MRAIEYIGIGGPEVIRVCERPKPALINGEVLIEVKAAGVNRPDVSQRLGNYNPPAGVTDIPGLDIAGIIVETCGECGDWRVGDRVCGLVQGGGYAEYCKAPIEHLMPIPEGLTFVQAAALPEVFFTAWNNLVLHGRLAQGEHVLIQGGASGVGVAAIQIAKQIFSATVLATASSSEKRAVSMELGADAVIDYRDPDWPTLAVAANAGRRFDLIIDNQAGDYVGKHISIMADDGRLVMLGLHGGSYAEVSCAEIVIRRLIVTGSTIRPRSPSYKQAIANALVAKVWPRLTSGEIRVPIQYEFPLSEAAAAHQVLDENRQIGKIVLIVND